MPPTDFGNSIAEYWFAADDRVQRWHPDKWTKNPQVAGEAKRRFQQIQEAYSGN